jgi:DUF4097 and DUF4098 domain-containing protein YvlB
MRTGHFAQGNTMKFAAFVTAAFIAFVAWAGSPVSMASDGRNVSSVNGSVSASPGEVYDTVSTVNGDVRVGSGATADQAKSVNGSIVLESDAKVGNVSTVNGSLRIGEGVAIAREATTVNGGVKIAERARVGGDVSTVSGEIELSGAEVTGKLSTRNGDIDLTNGARVRGGIHVKKKNDSNWGWGKDDPVRVHICATCIVDGTLQFDQPVELRVDTGAKIGQVVGDAVTRR